MEPNINTFNTTLSILVLSFFVNSSPLSIPELQKEINKKNRAHSQLIKDIASFESYKKRILSKANSFVAANIPKKELKSYYRCLRRKQFSYSKDVMATNTASCMQNLNFDSKEYNKLLGQLKETRVDLKIKKRRLGENLSAHRELLRKTKRDKEISLLKQKTVVKKYVTNFETMDRSVKSLKGMNKEANCTSSMETVDLEDIKQPSMSLYQGNILSSTKHDYQGSMGTCYANTARNLILGVTGGEHDPSFMDLALSFEEKNGHLSEDVGGQTCRMFNQTKNDGYCPKEYAPMESGIADRSGVFINLSDIEVQQTIIKAMKKVIESKEELLNSYDRNLIEHAILHSIKGIASNPKIKLPYHTPHRLGDPFLADLIYTGEVKGPTISRDNFRQQWAEMESIFFEKTLGMSYQDKRKVLKESMDRLGSSLGMQRSLFSKMNPSRIEKFLIRKISLSDQESIFATKSFKEGTKSKIFSSSLLSCNEDPAIDDFLSNLSDLQRAISSSGKDVSIFLSDGGVVSDREMLQLAIAPSCIHKDNRKKLDSKYHCETIPTFKKERDEANIKGIRSLITESLLRGVPVGNSLTTASISNLRSNHSNTIVGIRPSTNGVCEYKIRDSRDASSRWVSEKDFLARHRALHLIKIH